MERKYYNDKLFFNLFNQYRSADKIPNIEDYEIGTKTKNNLADIPINNDFVECL